MVTALGFLLVALGLGLIWSAFTGKPLKDEIVSALRGPK